MERELFVSEMFYSVQGEGITVGIPAFFIRLTGCNLLCGGWKHAKDFKLHDGATWACDTYSVWRRGTHYTFEQILEHLQQWQFLERTATGMAHIIFTGGEPLMKQQSIIAFVDWLVNSHPEYYKGNNFPTIEVETNATIVPSVQLDEIVTYWNTSPKLSNSGMPYEKRINEEALRYFVGKWKAIFKFVVSREQDWSEIKALISQGLVSREKIVLMPAGGSTLELDSSAKFTAELAKREGVRMCPRMHVNIWEKATGV